MDAKLKAKAMTDDQLDGVAGGRLEAALARKQDYGTHLEIGSRQEVNNETRRELGDLFNSKNNKQPTLNTYSYKFP